MAIAPVVPIPRLFSISRKWMPHRRFWPDLSFYIRGICLCICVSRTTRACGIRGLLGAPAWPWSGSTLNRNRERKWCSVDSSLKPVSRFYIAIKSQCRSCAITNANRIFIELANRTGETEKVDHNTYMLGKSHADVDWSKRYSFSQFA